MGIHATTWYKLWQHSKAFVIPIILYKFQKNPFCLIILFSFDISFYFIHVYIGQGQEETTLGDKFGQITHLGQQEGRPLPIELPRPALFPPKKA